MEEFTPVAQVGEIPEGEGRAFTAGGRTIAVFLDRGEYLAIDDFCPHMGASLAGGCVDDGYVVCPWHAWQFKLRDGAWLDNPKVRVDCFPVRIQEGRIEVQIPPREKPVE